MRFASLAEWLAWQEQLHPSEIELGLDRVKAVAARLPFFASKPSPITIVVGGTNGKGSCVAYLEAMLLAAGYRVGAYSSPHLLAYNERIRIQGRMVTDPCLCESFERVDAARQHTSLTYFEFGTLAALDIFYREQVDIRVLEVGLGGRLDAVNIVEPNLAIVVNVALDHEAWLGSTREAIGAEKAGIFRQAIPLLVGEPDPPQSLRLAAARLPGSQLYCLDQDFFLEEVASGWSFQGLGSGGLRPPALLLPQGQLPRPSAACALQALQLLGLLTPEAARRGLSLASLPGRFQRLQWRGRQVILDVAHNPAGAAFLAERLRQELAPAGGVPKVRAVFSAMADKDYPAAMAALLPWVSDWYLAALPLARGESLEKLCQSARLLGVPAQGFDTIAAALQGAFDASRVGDTLLVYGSFYTVAAALAHLNQSALSP